MISSVKKNKWDNKVEKKMEMEMETSSREAGYKDISLDLTVKKISM